MDKKNIGLIIITSGLILLSLEIFALSFFLYLDKTPTAWRSSGLEYIVEPNIIISLLISILIILIGLFKFKHDK